MYRALVAMGRMPRAFILLLLLVQVWIGFTRGQAVCIAWDECGADACASDNCATSAHVAAAPDVDPPDAFPYDQAPHQHRSHHHGPVPPSGAHDHGDDDRHAHVPAVGEENSLLAARDPLPPALPSPFASAALRSLLTEPAVAALRATRARVPAPPPRVRPRGPVLAFRV